MKDSVVAWIKQVFIGVPDVRFASQNPARNVIFQNHNADLVVQTWMGTRMFVHLIDYPIKLKHLRNMLKDNTNRGVGSMFIVDWRVLPQHGDEVTLSDWQDALSMLNDGWIYAYGENEDGISIIQVHFLPLTQPNRYYCWHMRDFEIQSVIVRSRSLHTCLKGNWKIGDVASSQFRRRINHGRMNHRYHYKTKRTEEIITPPIDELYAHYKLLGIERNATQTEVKTAYRKLAMKLHPDVSSYPTEEAEQRFKELNRAYEFVKNYHNWY